MSREDSPSSGRSSVSSLAGPLGFSFLQMAERSPHYGCCFYDVSRLDGSKCLLGVCSKGIVVSHPSEEYKIFYWKQLDNLYYKNNQFSLEVHGNR